MGNTEIAGDIVISGMVIFDGYNAKQGRLLYVSFYLENIGQKVAAVDPDLLTIPENMEHQWIEVSGHYAGEIYATAGNIESDMKITLVRATKIDLF
jgi:hypothetical protein